MGGLNQLGMTGETINIVPITLSPTVQYNFTQTEFISYDTSFYSDWNSQVCIDGLSIPGVVVTATLPTFPILGDQYLVKNNGTTAVTLNVVWVDSFSRKNMVIEPGYGIRLATIPTTGTLFDLGVWSSQNYFLMQPNTFMSDGFMSLYRGDLTNVNTIQADTLTDSTTSITSGSLTSAVFVSSSVLTDGTSSLSQGSLFSLLVTDGTGTLSAGSLSSRFISTSTLTDGTSSLYSGSLSIEQIAFGLGGFNITNLNIVGIRMGTFASTNYTLFPLDPLSITVQGINIGLTSQMPYDSTFFSFQLGGVQPYGVIFVPSTYDGGGYVGVHLTSQNFNNYYVTSGGGYLVRWIAITGVPIT